MTRIREMLQEQKEMLISKADEAVEEVTKDIYKKRDAMVEMTESIMEAMILHPELEEGLSKRILEAEIESIEKGETIDGMFFGAGELGDAIRKEHQHEEVKQLLKHLFKDLM